MITAHQLSELLSSLTTIPNSELKRLSDLSEDVIADLVCSYNKSTNDDKHIVRIDIGIGFLFIYYNDTEIKYKFRPSVQLSKKVVSALSGDSALQNKLEDVLNTKLLTTLKELL